MNHLFGRKFVVTGIVLGLSAVVIAGVGFTNGFARATTSTSALFSSPTRGAVGMMGSGGGNYAGGFSGMMGSGGGNAQNQGAITSTALAALVNKGGQGASIDPKTNTVTYTGRSLTLVALASPHGKPNMTWEIDGLVNPTVIIQPGVRVKVVLVNTDRGYMHGFELTTNSPPYSYMTMATVTDNFFLMPLPQRTTQNLVTASYYTRSASLTTAPGLYHYFCPVPGHAAAGMFGTLEIGHSL
jgi:rusticyanin